MDIEKEDSTLIKLLSTMNRCKEICECNELTTIEYILNKAMYEIQTLRAKVASAEVLVEAMSDIAYGMQTKANNNTVIKDTTVSRFADEIFKALATYDNQSEVKHD